MATRRLIFHSKVWVPARVCQNAAVCLVGTNIGDKMANGWPVVFGTIENTGRQLKSADMYQMLDARDSDAFQYELTYNDALLANVADPIVCADLGDIIYPACLFQVIVDRVVALEAP